MIKLDHRSVIFISGSDSISFLQNILTNDINAILEKPVYALMLTPQGKLLYDFFVLKHPNLENTIIADIPKKYQDAIIAKLQMYKLRMNVTIEVAQHFGVYANFDNMVNSKDVYLNNNECNLLRYDDPRNPQMGQRLVINEEVKNSKVTMIRAESDEEYHKLRKRFNILEVGLDIEPQSDFAARLGFYELNAISLTKGCYVGQEVTIRILRKNSNLS